MTMMKNWQHVYLAIGWISFCCASVAAELQCSAVDGVDPALKEMEYDIGYGKQTFLAYVEPNVTTFYQGKPPSSTKVVPKFTGLATKFINMSNKHVKLQW